MTTNVVTGFLVGVSGFELCYFGLSDILEHLSAQTFRFVPIFRYFQLFFCLHTLKGFSKGKNKGKLLMGTCFLQNHVYTNK